MKNMQRSFGWATMASIFCSLALIMLSSAPVLAGWPKVIFPSAGSTLAKGSTYTIQWKSVHANPVDIALCTEYISYEVNCSLYIAKNVPNSGGSGSYSWTVPSNLSNGSNYVIGVGVIGKSIGFSDLFTISDSVPPPRSPDLVVSTLNVSDPTPNVDQLFTINATVQNIGDASSSSGTLRYYHSTDSTITTGDVQLASHTVGGLSAGQNSSASQAVSIDLVGRFWVGACIDPVNGESSTDNNCSVGIEITVKVFDNSLPLPDARYVYDYQPTEIPEKQPSASLCKPFAVGDVAEGGGTLRLRVALPPFSNNVDIYLAIYSTAVDPNQVFLITAGDAIQNLDDGFDPWMANTGGNIDKTLYGDIPLSSLPSGTYNLYVLVTPAGANPFDLYYFWATYFLVP